MAHILISNDDGVHAPGINVLANRLRQDHRITVVAPLEERSTTGHSLTLDKPLRLEKISEGVWGCSGFPGDCSLVGLGHVTKGDRPQFVVTGINRGANLGQDMYYSGTIGAAREAAFHLVPSLATSLVFKSAKTEGHHYETAAEVAAWIVEAGLLTLLPKLSLLNLNVPDVPLKDLKGIKFTSIGFRNYSEEIHVREDARGRPYYWIAGHYQGFSPNQETDCYAIDAGYAAITPHGLIGSESYDWSEMKKAVETLHARHFS
ncbi:MAG: 5'/3'-nucleotidase SurE [Bacteriovoracaceae bacterium]|nr:5'/3'-nucleotidase SurE [Bacteriovoracaceae bacterium]